MFKKPVRLIEPYAFLPVDSGGKNRILNTVKSLGERYAVSVLLFDANEETKRYLEDVKITYQGFKTKAKSMYSKLPYWFSDWDNSGLRDAVSGLRDVAIVEFTQLLYVVDYLPKEAKKIFTAYDISTISFWRRLQSEKNVIKKIVHFVRWLQVYWYEKKYLPKYDQIIAVSTVDAKLLKKWFGIKNVVVVPNGIEKIDILPPRVGKELSIGFIGSPSHPPNQEAIRYLREVIEPALKNRQQPYRMIIADGSTHIPDVKYFYQQIDVLAAPLFAGSGSRIKILESLSYGRPVVTTTIGAEGIGVETPLIDIIENADDVNRWLDSIISVVGKQDELLSEKLKPLLWERTLSLIQL